MKIPAFTFLIVAFAIGSVRAQPEEHKGIQLYRQGRYLEAVSTLRTTLKQKQWKSNAPMWNVLGLAYTETKEYKNGRKAFEKAIKLDPHKSAYHSNLAYIHLMFGRPDKSTSEASEAIKLDANNAEAYYIRGTAELWGQKFDAARQDAERMVSIDTTRARGYLLLSRAIVGKLGMIVQTDPNSSIHSNIGLLKEARDALTKGVQVSKDDDDAKSVKEELESIQAFYDQYSKEPRKPGDPPEPGVTPVKILNAPRASYTDEARRRGVQGTIRVLVLLGADGKVKYVLFLKRLGSGLDEKVLDAARQIEFEPKMKDGHPVSTILTFEYSFEIY
jgi:TonB family protein